MYDEFSLEDGKEIWKIINILWKVPIQVIPSGMGESVCGT